MTRGTSSLVWGTPATAHSAHNACFRLVHTELMPPALVGTVCSVTVFASFSVIDELQSGMMLPYVFGRTLLIGFLKGHDVQAYGCMQPRHTNDTQQQHLVVAQCQLVLVCTTAPRRREVASAVSTASHMAIASS